MYSSLRSQLKHDIIRSRLILIFPQTWTIHRMSSLFGGRKIKLKKSASVEKRGVWWQVLLRNCFSGFILTERHHNKGIVVYKALESLSNYDDQENVKKQLVLWAKQLLCTCITLFSTFLWRSLHDYDVKPPNATFYGGRGHATTNFPCSIWTWIKPLRIQLQEKLPIFWRDKVWKDAN